jgi:hypothetical protein
MSWPGSGANFPNRPNLAQSRKMVEPDAVFERILVAMDSALRGDALLESAARLAAFAHVELTALFIEDPEVLQLAALPFACELDRASGALRAIEPESLEREMQAQARMLRRCVEGLREKHGIRANLRVVRGEFAAVALEAAVEGDILFFGAGTQVPLLPRTRGRERTGERLRFDVPGDAPVCVYFDNTPSARRAARLAGSWARAWGRRLWILAASGKDSGDAARESGGADAVIVVLADDHMDVGGSAASGDCTDAGGKATPGAVAGTAAEAGERPLREVLARSRCALLVLPRSQDGARLRRGGLLDAVSCPVVLVN